MKVVGMFMNRRLSKLVNVDVNMEVLSCGWMNEYSDRREKFY